MIKSGTWSEQYQKYERDNPKLTGFIKVLANKSIPPFLNVVKTILFVPKDNFDIKIDPHLVISLDIDPSIDGQLKNGEFILMYVNSEENIDNTGSRFVEVHNREDQMELIISFLIKYNEYIMVSRALVPFDLILINKTGGEINVGPTSIKLIWDSLSVGFQSFKFAVRHNFLGAPSVSSSR